MRARGRIVLELAGELLRFDAGRSSGTDDFVACHRLTRRLDPSPATLATATPSSSYGRRANGTPSEGLISGEGTRRRRVPWRGPCPPEEHWRRLAWRRSRRIIGRINDKRHGGTGPAVRQSPSTTERPAAPCFGDGEAEKRRPEGRRRSPEAEAVRQLRGLLRPPPKCRWAGPRAL